MCLYFFEIGSIISLLKWIGFEREVNGLLLLTILEIIVSYRCLKSVMNSGRVNTPSIISVIVTIKMVAYQHEVCKYI